MESGNVGASSLSCCSPLGSDNHGVPFHACKAPRSVGYPGEYRSGRNKNKMGTEHVFHDKLIYSISLLIPRGIITLHVVFRNKSNLAFLELKNPREVRIYLTSGKILKWVIITE